MKSRLIAATSILALVSACSFQPGPSSLSPLQLANQALQAGDYSAAEQAYSGILANSPDNATAKLGLAQVYEATDRSTEAVDLYRQVSSAQSGAIRVLDGGLRQDGVTEVATRRLGALGHGMEAQVATPAPAPAAAPVPAPVVVAAPIPAPVVQTEVWPDNPVYALDSNGIVYYADPEATQPVTMTVFETREAAEQSLPAVARHTIPAAIPIAPIAPVVQETFVDPAPIPLAPISVAPVALAPLPIAPISVEPIVQATVQPSEPTYALDSNGIVYYADPDATQPISERLFESPEAAALSAPAVTQRVIPGTTPISTASIAPAPINFQSIPTVVAPAPTTFAPAPVFTQPTEIVAPIPAPLPAPVPIINPTAAAPSVALPRTEPGYAVIDGDFVYISAEDIARASGGAAPVAPVGVPLAPQQSFTAPTIGVPVNPPLIELNGIPNINLN